MLHKMRVHAQGWMAWVFVGILGFVFALWGISDQFVGDLTGRVVAKVAGKAIVASEVDQVYNRMAQQSQMAQLMAGVQTPIIDEEVVRKQALDSLVIEKVLTVTAQNQGFHVSNQQVHEILMQLPQFQVNGEFSPALFERLLHQMNFTPQSFNDTIRKEMLITQAQSSIRDSAFVLPYQLDEAVSLINQKRNIQYALFNADTFAKEVNLTEADLEAYYNGHHSEFMTDESVMVAYVEVDKHNIEEKIKGTMHPTEQQLLSGYDEKMVEFTTPERRSAKHILVGVKPDDTPQQEQLAAAKANSIMDKLKQGASFAEMAQKNSDDPGSAQTGGDLGMFTRGEMVPEFDRAVFEGKAGDLIGPVKTDFGYHVILIGSIQPARVKPFAEVKDTLIKEWIEDKVTEEFERCLSDLDQLAFEHSEELEKVAQALNLPIHKMTMVADLRKSAGLASNPQVHQAGFSDEVLYARKNSDVIRVSPDNAVVLRVIQHQDPVLKPFDEVKTELESSMRERQALYLARTKANDILESYRPGEVNPDELAKSKGFTWTTVKGLTRQNQPQLPSEVLQAAFSVPVISGQSVMVGAQLPERASALVLVDTITPGTIEGQFAQAMTAEFTSSLQDFYGIRDFNFYVAAAKEKAKVEIKK